MNVLKRIRTCSYMDAWFEQLLVSDVLNFRVRLLAGAKFFVIQLFFLPHVYSCVYPSMKLTSASIWNFGFIIFKTIRTAKYKILYRKKTTKVLTLNPSNIVILLIMYFVFFCYARYSNSCTLLRTPVLLNSRATVGPSYSGFSIHGNRSKILSWLAKSNCPSH